MKSKRITEREFFTQPDEKNPAEKLAKELLGKILCRRVAEDFIIKGRITVTEAYCVKEDVTDATIAEEKGEKTTQHNEGGYLYVARQGRPGGTKEDFRIDIVAGKADLGESVLIRGIDPYSEGPINAAWALDITNDNLNGRYLPTDKDIWLEEDGVEIIPNPATQRKLSDKAPKCCREKLLRFTIKEIKFPNC